ncbi:MAG: PQQ-binding-like beta-propeller repeat protein [Candidatus Solibacter usitatus]|nr:PQQ-binding-like beta-propeller repeat protein [Candidatus Solibacter usitatus]
MAISGSRVFALAVLAAGSTIARDDWPQWRGPQRDGALLSFIAPKSWPETMKRKWTVTLGEGHASPVLASGKIFVFTRQQSEEALTSIDPDSGKVLWRAAYPAPYKVNPAADRHGAGPKSTPVVYQGKVFTLGIGGVLSSFDAATGKPGWRKNFSGEFRETSPWYGTATSPVVDGGMVIAHVGGHDDGAWLSSPGRGRWSPKPSRTLSASRPRLGSCSGKFPLPPNSPRIR